MSENTEWQEVCDAPAGRIFKDWFENNNIRCLIMKGRLSLYAFIGVPKNHPLAGLHFIDVPLRINSNLCLMTNGLYQETLPKNYYWYGWHYESSCDESWFDDSYTLPKAEVRTVKMVEENVREALIDFERLALLAEKITIKNKESTWKLINEEFIDYLREQHDQHNKI